ncbi:MAG: hypothetical protein ACXVBY_23330, partial [Isosphaeraceae bacterium]
MPLPVMAATVTVALVLALNTIGLLVSPASLQSLAGIVFAALLLVGLLRAHRLAWQWGRYLAPFSGLIFIVAAFANFSLRTVAGRVDGAVSLLLGFGMLAFPILLSRQPSARY